MTGNQLKDYIDMFQLGNYQVVVGCKNEFNATDVDNGTGVTRVELFDGKIFIHDQSNFDEKKLHHYELKEKKKGGSTL